MIFGSILITFQVSNFLKAVWGCSSLKWNHKSAYQNPWCTFDRFEIDLSKLRKKIIPILGIKDHFCLSLSSFTWYDL